MKENNSGVKRRKYDASFKEEILQMISNGRLVSKVARSSGIGENLIYHWRSRSSAANVGSRQPNTVVVGKENSPAAGEGPRFHCSNTSASWSKNVTF